MKKFYMYSHFIEEGSTIIGAQDAELWTEFYRNYPNFRISTKVKEDSDAFWATQRKIDQNLKDAAAKYGIEIVDGISKSEDDEKLRECLLKEGYVYEYIPIGP